MPSSSLIIPLLFIIEGISGSGILACKPCNFLCRKEGQTFLMQVISESFTSHSFHTPCHQKNSKCNPTWERGGNVTAAQTTYSLLYKELLPGYLRAGKES